MGMIGNAPVAGTIGTGNIQDGGVETADIKDGAVTTAKLSANLQGATFGFKNRIINGAMVIDQRNAGASITQNTTGEQFSADRWLIYGTVAGKFTSQQTPSATETGFATRVGAGFSTYLGITSTSAYSVVSSDIFQLSQTIEGFNFSDMAWGTANAKTVTLSFLVYSSLTGTFGGSLLNSAVNRSYPFTYSIPTANTWTQISVTIAGDTSGTWIGATNGVGLRVIFSFGMGSNYSGTAGSWASGDKRSATGATSVVGTSGATFYITGVQLEKGSTATSFDYRPYGTELALCQRYFEKSYRQQDKVGTTTPTGYQVFTTGTNSLPQSFGFGQIFFKVTKRASAPTCAIYSYTSATVGVLSNGSNGADLAAASATLNAISDIGFNVYNNSGTTLTTASYSVIYMWTADAEL